MCTRGTGIRGLVCSSKGLKILSNICEKILGICRLPLGLSLQFVVLTLPCMLKVHVVDDQIVDEVQAWTKIALDAVE